ncbi:MAG: ATP-binding protein [Planctomycetota bacterium]|nr:ATP-binding protein [Planctomycetota bacterium]
MSEPPAPHPDAFHTLLQRQVRRIYGDMENVPQELQAFLPVVDEAYRQADVDRRMLERSLDLSSHELLQANADLRAVVEDFVDVFFRLDAKGVILDCRGGNEDCMMLPPKELIGRRIQDIPFPEIGERFARALDHAQRQAAVQSFDYGLPLSETVTHYEAHVVPLPHNQFIVIIRDVTATKQSEARERELNARLARYRRMESLGMLAGGVAHDLNNILGPLVAYPELILPRVAHDASVVRDVLQIKESATRAAAVIQDLLILARRGGVKADAVRLNEVVRGYLDSAAFLELRARRPEVRFRKWLEAGCPPILGTSHHMSQIVMNLVVNAYEAVQGSGDVSLSSRAVVLDRPVHGFETIEDGHYVVLAVRDTGHGISESDLEHIFEPFYSTKKLGRSGSGLGLAVVYGIVKDSGGYIDVKTSQLRGSEFLLYLPVAPEQVGKEVGPVGVHGGTEHILVVDDVPEQRTLAARLLERLGYRVSVVPSGRKAVTFLRQNLVDLVLLDMIMEEDFDGLITYQEILAFRPEQRCVLATGFAETDRVRQAQLLGAGACIQKPYSLKLLGNAIRAELDRSAIAPTES